MLETSEELNGANNIIRFPLTNEAPTNLEEFNQLLLNNKMEVIDAFVDEIMTDVLRICYAYGYTALNPKDISYILISLKSSIMRHENISHDFQKRVDAYVDQHINFICDDKNDYT